MKSQRNNLKPFEEFPIVSTQFDYIEFGLIKEKNLYTVIYTFVKPNHETQSIEASCTVETNIKSFSYVECAKQITSLILLGIFTVPVSATGTVYTPDYEEIEEVNWNNIQRECADLLSDSSTHIIH